MSPSKKPIRMEVNESIKIDQPSSVDARPGGSDSESRSPTENDSKILESKYNKMRDTLGAHPASGLSLLAESAARLPLTADRPNMREQLLAKAVEKKQVHYPQPLFITCFIEKVFLFSIKPVIE